MLSSINVRFPLFFVTFKGYYVTFVTMPVTLHIIALLESNINLRITLLNNYHL